MVFKELNDLPSFLAGDHTELKEVFHPKNGDANLPFSLAYASLAPGTSSLPHSLQSAELYLIINGSGEAIINQERFSIGQGSCFLVEPSEEQYLSNSGTTSLDFFCIVSPPWKSTEEVIS